LPGDVSPTWASTNVVAALGDLLQDHPGPVDAVMGRLILMWVPRRAAVLRACAQALAPGSLVWFLEPELTYDLAMPSSPLWAQVQAWVVRTLEGVGAECRMGPKLCRAFCDAGLSPVALESRTIMAGGPTAPVWFVVNVARALLPMMSRFGVTTPAERTGCWPTSPRTRPS
jgi:hypothetical protein